MVSEQLALAIDGLDSEKGQMTTSPWPGAERLRSTACRVQR